MQNESPSVNLRRSKAIGLLQSKSVWVAFIMFLFAVLRYFGVGLPDALAQEIVNQDWTNIVQALISVAILIARTLFLGTPIKGLWQSKV